MVEVNTDLLLVERLDHSRQLALGGILKDDQQTFAQRHVGELAARHDLHILWIRLAKALLRTDWQAAFVAGLETEQCLLEARQQVAIAHAESGRGLALGAVYQIAVLQTNGEVQGNLGLRPDTLLSLLWWLRSAVP